MLLLLPRSTLFPYTTLFRSSEDRSRRRVAGENDGARDGECRCVPRAAHEKGAIHRVPRRFGKTTHRRQDRRSEEHTSELQSPCNLVCRLLLEKKKENYNQFI